MMMTEEAVIYVFRTMLRWINNTKTKNNETSFSNITIV